MTISIIEFMSKADCDIRIGTSGWYYDHWKERFYPAGLPKSKWFEHYAEHFDTVEINNTFYHLPKAQSVQRWHQLAPKGFLYAVKANRYITHIKRLKDTSEELKRFFERVALLKGHLGPILYQLPPSLHQDLDLLKSFIKLLPKGKPSVFEFRHESWYCDDMFDLLREFRPAGIQAATQNPHCRLGPNGSRTNPRKPAASTPISTTTSKATQSKTQNN